MQYITSGDIGRKSKKEEHQHTTPYCIDVIGRNEPTGYMMSPFGDERWDVDDNEKLWTIFKKKNISGPHNHNENVAHSTQSSLPTYKVGQQSTHEQIKQPCYTGGYIHQSGTAQGYMPKSEVAHNYTSHHEPAQNYHQYQANHSVQSQQSPSNVESNYHNNAAQAIKHYNGLNQEDIKKRSRVTYSQPLKCETQSLSQIPSICERCKQSEQGTPKSQEYILQKNWSRPSVEPVLIAGEASYRPFGPQQATPAPFYPSREFSYLPLR